MINEKENVYMLRVQLYAMKYAIEYVIGYANKRISILP